MKKCLYVTVLLVFANVTHATVIQFEGVAPFGGASTIPITPYTEGGFILTADSAHTAIISSTTPRGATWASDYFSYNAPNTVATLTEASLLTFDLVSLDLGLSSSANLESPVDVTLTGFLAGGGTIGITVSSVLEVEMQTLNWTGLSSVTISATDDVGLDNINVTAIPEPASMALIGLVATGIYFKRRFFIA